MESKQNETKTDSIPIQEIILKEKPQKESEIELKMQSNNETDNRKEANDPLLDKKTQEQEPEEEEEGEEIDEIKYNLNVEEYTESGMSTYKFSKDKIGMVLFFFVFFAILIQTISVYITYDFREDTNLYHFKFLFYITAVMAVWSHIRASLQNPGKIIHHNNTTVINFYLNTRTNAMKNAENFNKKLGYIFFPSDDKEDSDIDSDEEVRKKKRKEREERKKKRESEKKEDTENSSSDEDYYRPVSAMCDNEMKRMQEDYKLKLTRCRQCYVVRILRAHHCTSCKG